MKGILLALLMMVSGSAAAFESCWTGAWYDPGRDGEGIVMEVLNDNVVVWFYRPGTASSQRWYLMVGDNEPGTHARLITYQQTHVGGAALENGTAGVSMKGNDMMKFSYHFNYDFTTEDGGTPWCIGCSDTTTYVRLSQPIPCE